MSSICIKLVLLAVFFTFSGCLNSISESDETAPSSTVTEIDSADSSLVTIQVEVLLGALYHNCNSIELTINPESDTPTTLTEQIPSVDAPKHTVSIQIPKAIETIVTYSLSMDGIQYGRKIESLNFSSDTLIISTPDNVPDWLSIGNDTTITIGDRLLLTPQINDDSKSIFFSYDFTNSGTFSEPYKMTFTTAGQFIVVGKAFDGYSELLDTIAVTVIDPTPVDKTMSSQVTLSSQAIAGTSSAQPLSSQVHESTATLSSTEPQISSSSTIATPSSNGSSSQQPTSSAISSEQGSSSSVSSSSSYLSSSLSSSSMSTPAIIVSLTALPGGSVSFTSDNSQIMQVAPASFNEIKGTPNSGYTFKYWNAMGAQFLNSNASTTLASCSIDCTITGFFAPVFSISYDNNTGSGAPSTVNSYEEGSSVTALGNAGSMIKSGWTFNGWNTQTNGNGTPYQIGSQITVQTQNITLYAQWLPPTFQITYNGNGNTSGSVSDANSYAIGSNFMVKGGTSLSKTGHTFSGWETSNGTSFTVGTSYPMIDGGIELIAQWDLNSYSIILRSSVELRTYNTINVQHQINSSISAPIENFHTISGWRSINGNCAVNTAANPTSTISCNGGDIIEATFNEKANGTFYDERPPSPNTYSWARIGFQVWMSENLDYNSPGSECWENDTLCYQRGRYYTWGVAMNGGDSSNSNPSNVRGVCPHGWHMPSTSEVEQLINFTGNNAASLKTKSNWQSPGNGTDIHGFSAAPWGSYHPVGGWDGTNMSFTMLTTSGGSSWVDYMSVTWSYSDIQMGSVSVGHKASIRCILD